MQAEDHWFRWRSEACRHALEKPHRRAPDAIRIRDRYVGKSIRMIDIYRALLPCGQPFRHFL